MTPAAASVRRPGVECVREIKIRRTTCFDVRSEAPACNPVHLAGVLVAGRKSPDRTLGR